MLTLFFTEHEESNVLETLQLMNYPSPPHFSNVLLKSKDSYEIGFAPEPRMLKL